MALSRCLKRQNVLTFYIETMARNRMIRPQFWESEPVSRLSMQARLLFIGLWNFADDEGVITNNHSFIKSRVFPYDENVRPTDMSKWLTELSDARMIVPVKCRKDGYYVIRSFREHQKIDKPSKTTFDRIGVSLNNIMSEHGYVVDDEGAFSLRETLPEPSTSTLPQVVDDSFPKVKEENKEENNSFLIKGAKNFKKNNENFPKGKLITGENEAQTKPIITPDASFFDTIEQEILSDELCQRTTSKFFGQGKHQEYVSQFMLEIQRSSDVKGQIMFGTYDHLLHYARWIPKKVPAVQPKKSYQTPALVNQMAGTLITSKINYDE